MVTGVPAMATAVDPGGAGEEVPAGVAQDGAGPLDPASVPAARGVWALGWEAQWEVQWEVQEGLSHGVEAGWAQWAGTRE